MIDRLRQLSEPRLRLLAEIEKSQTPLERDILVQWVRKQHISWSKGETLHLLEQVAILGNPLSGDALQSC